MSIASVLIASDQLETARCHREAALLAAAVHRPLPHRSRPAAALRGVHHRARASPCPPTATGLDADRFDEFCDHLLVREDNSGELVGCYRMLPPPGAIAAGGLYTATEFDVTRVGRAAAVAGGDGTRGGARRSPQRRGGAADVGRASWPTSTGAATTTSPAAYRCPTHPEADGRPPGSQLRGVRDFVLRRHAAPPRVTVHPYRPVVIDGRSLDDIDPPARPAIPPLMRGYLRLGAQVCGEPAHDPEFGVGDFPALLDKRQADTRYLTRLRSVSAAAETAGGSDERQRPSSTPGCRKATCDDRLCARRRRPAWQAGPCDVALRCARITWRCCCCRCCRCWRCRCPGAHAVQRLYCRMLLRCLGVRITLSGGPIRNLRGVLVVSGHVCWVDIFTIGAVLPGALRRPRRPGGLARRGSGRPHHEGHPDRPRQPAQAAAGGRRRRRPAAGRPDRGRLPRGHHLVRAGLRDRSGRPCSRPPSTPGARSSRCG